MPCEPGRGARGSIGTLEAFCTTSHRASSSYGETPRSKTEATNQSSLLVVDTILPMNLELERRTAHCTKSGEDPQIIKVLATDCAEFAVVASAIKNSCSLIWCCIFSAICQRKSSSSFFDNIILTPMQTPFQIKWNFILG